MSLLLAFVTASFFLEMFVLCYFSRVFSGNDSSVYIHWDSFILFAIRSFVRFKLLSQGVPPSLLSARIVVPSVSQGFFNNTEAPNFMPGLFFPIIYGFGPYVSFEYCRKYTFLE